MYVLNRSPLKKKKSAKKQETVTPASRRMSSPVVKPLVSRGVLAHPGEAPAVDFEVRLGRSGNGS